MEIRKWKKMKKALSAMMAVTVFVTSIPPIPVFAKQESGYVEGDGNDVDVDIIHELRAGNTEADVFVKASASDANYGEAGGVKRVEVKDSEGKRIKGGTKAMDAHGDEAYRFRVKENDTYKVYVYYEIQEEIEPDSGVIGGGSQGADIPSSPVETPEAETPEAEAPEAETSEVETAEAETPEAETPEVETSEVETAEAETPEEETTEEETSEEETAEAETAEVETAEVETSDKDVLEGADSDNPVDENLNPEPFALKAVDFFFPVIDAYGASHSVEKVLIYDYEVNDLYTKGIKSDISVSIDIQEEDMGARVTIVASPSDAYQEGEAFVQGITLLADKDDAFYLEEDIREFEYQEPEYDIEHGSATFYVRQNGPYYIGICYDDAQEIGESLKSVLIPYEVNSKYGIRYIGADNVTITEGEVFGLMDGVRAVNRDGADVDIAVANDGGFRADVPGTYIITYAPASEMRKRSATLNNVRERTVEVTPRAAGDLTIVSDIHGEESLGKTLKILPMQRVDGLLTVSFKLPSGENGRYLKFELPKWISVKAWPSGEYDEVETRDVDSYTTEYALKIKDTVSAQAVSFELLYDSYISPKTLSGGVESYVKNKGIVNIGKIKVSGGYRNSSGTAVEIDRQDIGEFVTEPMTDSVVKAPLGIKKTGVFSESSAVHQVLRDSHGNLPFESRLAAGSDSNHVFFLDTAYQGGRPYIIEKLRVFAPENFKFSVGSGYTDKITLGQEASGIWYADITVKSDNGAALKGLSLEKEDGYTLVFGTFTSLPSIVTYTTYGEDGSSLVTESYETTPLVSIVAASNRVYVEEDLLNVYATNYSGGEVYAGESNRICRFVAKNEGKHIKTENGIEYYSEPNYDGSNLEFSFKMPGNNQIMPTKLVFYGYAYSNSGQFPSGTKVREIRLTLTDGSERIFSPEDVGLPRDLTKSDAVELIFPEGEYKKRVQTVNVIMDKFYAANLSLYLEVTVNPDIESTLPTDGRLTETAGTTQARINDKVIYRSSEVPGIVKMYPSRSWKLSYGWGGSDLLNSYRYVAAIEGGSQGVNATRNNIEITYNFTDDDGRSKFLDKLTCYYPVTITIESMGGKSSTYTTSRTIDLNPWSDDYIKKLVLKFPSIKKNSNARQNIAKITTNTDFNQWKEAMTYLKDNEVQLPIGCTIGGISSEGLMLDNVLYSMPTGTLCRNGTVTISESPDKVVPSDAYTKYQGDILEYSLPDYYFNFKREYNFNISFLPKKFRWKYQDTYVFLNDEDSVSFIGVEAPWKYEKISAVDGTVIKLYRDDSVSVTSSLDFKASLPAPKLKFNVLQGGAATKIRPVKAVWFDMDQIPDLEYAWFMEDATRVKVPTERFESGTGFTDHNVIKYTNETDFREVNILKSNKTGVFLTAGVNGSYIGEEAEGKSGDSFAGRVYLQTGSSVSNNYEVILTLPRKGVSTTDESGTTYTSAYSMSLDRAVSVTGISGTPLKALYQMSGSSNYIEDSAVTDWKQVTKIKLIPKTGTSVAAQTEQTISLPMSSFAKDGLGEQIAYLNAEYHAGGIAGKRKPVSYKLIDYTVSIDGWKDDDENGRFDSATEPTIYTYEFDVYENETKLIAESDYDITATSSPVVLSIPNGKNLSLRLDMLTIPSGYNLLPANTTSSSFDKTNGTLDIPFLERDVTAFKMGVVKIGTLNVENPSVKKDLTKSLELAWTSLPATAPSDQYTYSFTIEDETIASIKGTEVTGLKPGTTKATVTAVNKFGDAVTAEFNISVGTNLPPVIVARDWTVIEGDTIGDIWKDVTLHDPDDSFPVADKTVTVWTNPEKTIDISLEEAIQTPGIYTVTYEAKDVDLNSGTDDGILTVYGKLQAPAEISDGHFYLPETGGVALPDADFTYINSDGADLTVKVPQTNPMILSGKQTAKFEGVHPKMSQVSADVKIGSGHSASATADAYVDTAPILTGLPEIQTTVMVGTSVDLLAGIKAAYTHYASEDSSGEAKDADIVLVDGDGNPITGTVEIIQPGSYTYHYTATAPESYDNSGTNQSTATRTVNVIGKAEIAVEPGTVYVTPEQSKDANYILSKTEVTASYIDTAGNSQAIHPGNIRYAYEMDGEVITKVTIQATVNVGGVQNSAEPKTVDVVVREIPVIQTPPILLRADASLEGDSVDVELGIIMEPLDEHNTYTVKKDINPKEIGRYEAVFTATDGLTGASADYTRYVYVSGTPELKASSVAISTHQSTGEDALIEAVKKGIEDPANPGSYVAPVGEVTYVLADGKVKLVKIHGADITYEVQGGYQSGTEGRYKVILTVKDTNVLNQSDLEGITEASTSLEVEVVVSDRKYNIEISDGGSGKGTFEEGTTYTPEDIVHGGTIQELPTPKPEDGYHFDGYEIGSDMTTKEDIVLKDGTVIPKGETVPKGTILTEEQVKNLVVEGDVELEAKFSAPPNITGNHVSLYQNDGYDNSQFGIIVTDKDDGDEAVIVIDDTHVDTSVPGTYQVKVTVTDNQGNTTEKYFYVQIVGRPEITANADLFFRMDADVKASDITESITATYKKPADIPETPWEDTHKSNITVTDTEIVITDSMITTIPDTAAAGLKQLEINVAGAMEGNEEQGNTAVSKKVYVYGKPVITADYNELFTHLAVNENALIEAIRTGLGSGVLRQPAMAYIEIPNEDGTVEKVRIDDTLLTYQVIDLIPATEGSYRVLITVNDSSILSELGLDEKGITPVTVTLERGVAVGNRIYNVGFESGEHGTFEGGNSIQIPAVHGKSPLVSPVKPNEGYEFMGWMDQAGNRISDITNYPITADTVITAIYEKQEYIVKFFGRNDLVIKTEQVKYGDSATAPVDHPDVNHRLFDGWDKEITSVKENLDVRAKYRSNSGGSGGGSTGGSPGGSGGGNTGGPGDESTEGGNTGGGNTEGGNTEGGNTGDGNTEGGNTGGGNTGGGNTGGGNTGGGNTGGGNTEGGNNPGQDIDDNDVPLGNITVPGITPDRVTDGNSLPTLDDDKPIAASRTDKNSSSLSVEKIESQKGQSGENTEKNNTNIPDELVPGASAPGDTMQKKKGCIIHIILFMSAILGAIYQLLRIRKNKEELDELNETLENGREEN